MGLYLGGSAISMFEIIDFITYNLALQLRHLTIIRRGRAQQQKTERTPTESANTNDYNHSTNDNRNNGNMKVHQVRDKDNRHLRPSNHDNNHSNHTNGFNRHQHPNDVSNTCQHTIEIHSHQYTNTLFAADGDDSMISIIL